MAAPDRIDPDDAVNWARTPHGQNVHIVPADQSALAMGKRDASDYSALCGRVPDAWDRQSSRPVDPDAVCAKCAYSALGTWALKSLDAQPAFLRRAAP